VNVVLIWVGFGSLAGLLARIVLPIREPSGPLPTLTLGITGSAVGLGILSWATGNGPMNPISLAGFLAATAGALGLLVLFRVLQAIVPRAGDAATADTEVDEDDEELDEEDEE
jgi:uncharacterized membrane protein YeaQ/YmgE (transglycosylase-associated protein family)